MSPNKLTDTQLVVLSAAAQREDGAIGPAEGPKGGLAKKTIGKLLTDGLVEEVPAGGMPVWRRDDDRVPLALCITPRGLAAIGVEKASALPVAPPLSGKAAEDGEPTPDARSQGTSAVRKATPNRRGAARRKRSSDELRQRSASPRSQGVSKQSRVIEMLQRGQGSTIAAIVKATGWQPHSGRGFFAGVVRKKLGLTVVSEKTGTERVYLITVNNPARKGKGRR
jgi:hypothetical protein